MHACVHGAGQVVALGSLDVLAGGLPAAKLADLCTCTAGGGLVIQGAATVQIDGFPAARMADTSSHSGSILLGCSSVEIGGPTFCMPAAIKVVGDVDFQRKVMRDLYRISRTPTGKALLESIDKSGKTVTIVPAVPGDGNDTTYDNAKDRLFKKDGSPGDGTNSTISYDPDETTIGKGTQPWQTRPPAIGLAHELVHADQASYGTMKDGDTNNDSKPDPAAPWLTDRTHTREAEAAGIPPNDTRQYNDNKIRNEWDPQQPQRQWY
jgi:type VI secretion system secreted protein VgrG